MKNVKTAKTTMTSSLEGYPYLVIKQAESIGLGKTNAEIIRQALQVYAEKHGLDPEEQAYALAAKHILEKDKFKKAKTLKELLP